uniref:tRNA(Ile)-lysidine synthase, chloroplastic n=1 Tax=Dipterosiphonia australica TaxID=2007208 RepID=A0A1Z1MLV3_9FLOR|nr:tRNA Ile-lysidine synthetase [Dipterosiphonia australica]ARW66775.1 tRNA Ile-lysidine synthetase [Dipterosiphonia australica]
MKQDKINEIKTLINFFIDKYQINSILVALSGGQDSMYLIKTLKNLEKLEFKKKITISYIYVDHQWKYSSNKQVKHIINYIKFINTNIIIYQISKNTLSEDECRRYRYKIILQHAIRYQHRLIITGHNKTDKIETFIQNIIRGSGIENLNNLAMKTKITNNIFILRPLLILNRNIIYWLCKKFHLPIWSDNTNYIYSIQRNRIRCELIPYLKKYMHNNIENNIQYLLKHYYHQNEYIKQNVVKIYLRSKHDVRIAINCKKINTQNLVLQMRIIQMFCFHNFQIYIEHQKIIRIIKDINTLTKGLVKITQYEGFNFLVTNSWLYLTIK